jgi:hypothetical protein
MQETRQGLLHRDYWRHKDSGWFNLLFRAGKRIGYAVQSGSAAPHMPIPAPHTESGVSMQLRRTNPLVEILRPLGQLLLFVLVSSAAITAFTLLSAFLLSGTRDDMDLMQITLILLPQVLIDGLVLGFMYATIALGYTRV